METKFRTYQFHHNQIEFSEELLHFKNLQSGQTSRIESKEALVFILLIENANRLCTKEQLHQCWAPSYVTDSALTRVISLLRRHLREVGADNIITTNQKRGYKLETNVSEIPSEDTISEPKSSRKELLTPGKAFVFSMILVALLGTIAAVSYKPESQIPKHYKVAKSLHKAQQTKSTQYQNPSLSPNGDYLIYTKSQTTAEHWKLEWLNLATMQRYNHQHEQKHFVTPVWRDATTFAYHAYTDETCEIRLASLAKDAVIEDNLLTRCGPLTKSKSLAWKDAHHIYFTDSNSLSQPHSLYEVNIDTLSRKLVKSTDNYGRGIYGVQVNQTREKVALMFGDDWGKTTIQLFDIENLGELTGEFQVNLQLFSLGWLADDNLVYQNESGGVSVHHTALNISTDLTFPPDDYFSNPSVGGRNKLALIKGAYYSLGLFSITESEISNMVEASFGNYPGHTIKTMTKVDDTTYFVSNVTGINQIYRAEQGSATRISNFENPIAMSQLTVSESLGITVIVNHNRVVVYELSNGEILEELYSSGDANSVCIHKDELLMVLVKDKVPDIYSIDLNSFNIMQRLTTTGALHCQSHNNTLYYSRQNAAGLWQYIPDSDDQQILNQPISKDYAAWVFDHKKLWFISTNNELMTTDLHQESLPNVIRQEILSVYPGESTPKILAFAMLPNQIQVLQLVPQQKFKY